MKGEEEVAGGVEGRAEVGETSDVTLQRSPPKKNALREREETWAGVLLVYEGRVGWKVGTHASEVT